jgi:hypothetical protein
VSSLKIKIPSKNLARHGCGDGFNYGAEGLKYIVTKLLFKWLDKWLAIY